jgi:hypothetical protein
MEIMNLGSKKILKEFVIISKKNWLLKKDEFKKIKLDLQIQNKDIFEKCFKKTNEDINIIKKGTLIILKDLPEKINKNDIKIWISHFIEPAYVDYNSNNKECIIRFSHPIFADYFLNTFNHQDKDYIFDIDYENSRKLNGKILYVEKMEGDDEDKYIKKVEKRKKEFSFKKKNKKISSGNKFSLKN